MSSSSSSSSLSSPSSSSDSDGYSSSDWTPRPTPTKREQRRLTRTKSQNAAEARGRGPPPAKRSLRSAPPTAKRPLRPAPPARRAVGIDLGTTYSCVAALVNGTLEVIANRDFGERTTPSCVALADGEEAELVGEAARCHAVVDPTNVVVEAKRLIGRHFREESLRADLARWPFEVTEGAAGRPLIRLQHEGQPRTYSPQEISSKVLLKLKADAEAFLGGPVTEAVITVPAYFCDSQRRATKEAGELAGLKVLQLLPEPTAAAVAYGVERLSDAPRRVLVYDLGGGTFDVSVVLVAGLRFEVMAVGGNSHLGGADFDHLIAQHVAQEIELRVGQDVRGNPRKMRRLLTLCEQTKRDLSACMKATIDLESIVLDDLSIVLHRAKFEELIRDFLNSTVETIKATLTCAKLSTGDVDEVILVGGSTRMPCVERLLAGLFPGTPVRKTVNADEAVAHGAALWAAVKAGDEAAFLKGLHVQNVVPLSLGVKVGAGKMGVLIPRNHVLPARKVRQLETSIKNQAAVGFKVYQGERRVAERNKFVGMLSLRVPRSPPGLGLDFALAVDEDGILTAEAKLQSSTKWKRCTLRVEDVSSVDIITNLEDAERYRDEDEKELQRLRAKKDLECFLMNKEGNVAVKFLPQFWEVRAWFDSNPDASTVEFGKKLDDVKRLIKY